MPAGSGTGSDGGGVVLGLGVGDALGVGRGLGMPLAVAAGRPPRVLLSPMRCWHAANISPPRNIVVAGAAERGRPRQASILFDPDAWKKGRARWDDALYEATQNDTVSPFLPTPDYVASWAPFLARVAAERKPLAKVQLAGPMTLEWTLRSADGQLPARARLSCGPWARWCAE